MKTIKDIRLYKSQTENTDENPLPQSLAAKSVNVALHRIAMKLREQDFSLGDFDHLYLNFTPCIAKGAFQPAKRTVDRYFPWYRYYDFGVDEEMFDKLDSSECADFILESARLVLLNCFCDNVHSEQKITNAFIEAKNGENMLVRFKVKQGAKYKAVIFLRYLESAEYSPLLCVYNPDGAEILREDLPPISDLSSIGEIQLNSKRVTVKPRKNSFSRDLTAISFDLQHLITAE